MAAKKPTVPRDLTLESVIRTRAEEISAWLKEYGQGCQDKQLHLDADMPERVYWHYGYLVALRDVIAYLDGEKDALH